MSTLCYEFAYPCSLFASCLLIGATIVSAAEPGFKSLFDGKTLTGWEGNRKSFVLRTA